MLEPPAIRAAGLRPSWIAGGGVALLVAGVAGLSMGAVPIAAPRILLELLDHVPGIDVRSGLSPREADIVWELRAPRVALGFLVGAMLAVAGASFQGVFRNPLADPYLLGAAAGAGLGATIAIGGHLDWEVGPFDTIPLAAFVGTLVAVFLAYAVSTVGGRDPSPAVLLLAGVAVMTFLTAVQTFLLQRQADTIREVYTFILGRLLTAGWGEVVLVLPYAGLSITVLLLHRRRLDVLAVGDDEATSLGVDVTRTRLVIVVFASLATAAAVSVSGLIGFVGLVVPHIVRLLAGSSFRVVLPLSVLFGAAFLVLADLVARTALSPSEIPIGVVTAFFGAPFFVLVLRARGRLV
ncbi:MAG TPA: iron ABC transporter permease [Acidimicrobiales bacterium]|nr:iron ABC transporter permease [Acidimicrobiales bacterium]